MLDLDLILGHTDDVAKRLATKGLDPAKVYSARDSVVHRRQVRTKLDELRSQMNQRSKEMGRRSRRTRLPISCERSWPNSRDASRSWRNSIEPPKRPR